MICIGVDDLHHEGLPKVGGDVCKWQPSVYMALTRKYPSPRFEMQPGPRRP